MPKVDTFPKLLGVLPVVVERAVSQIDVVSVLFVDVESEVDDGPENSQRTDLALTKLEDVGVVVLAGTLTELAQM